MEEGGISRLSTFLSLIAASAVALSGGRGFAADADHSDWPCIQRKVEALTAAQMWDGPFDESIRWRDNEEITKLVAFLASRRVPLDDATAAIARFADAWPQEGRDDALKRLFAGLLSTINGDRAVVLSGIERFQRRQRDRAAELERQAAVIRQLKAGAASGEAARAELAAVEDRYQWDARIFTERQQSLPLACEVPVLMEQRLFALAREIRSHMND